MKGNPVKKETKEKIKNWFKSEAPYLAIATAGVTGVTIVFKKYLEQSNDIYQKQMQQRTDNQNQNEIDYWKASLREEFNRHHPED